MSLLIKTQSAFADLINSRSFRLLVVASFFSVFLSIARLMYTGSFYYFFLIWNLFLAAIPWIISRSLRRRTETNGRTHPVLAWSLRMIWLLFLPNAPYIITDLYHLRWSDGYILWYDVLLILSYAWTGLLFGVSSIRDMEIDLRATIGAFWTRVMIPMIIFLTAFGIYIGRFQRWNSWDVLTQPKVLLYELSDVILHPMTHPRAWGVTILMGVFLNLVYWSVKSLRPSQEREVL